MPRISHWRTIAAAGLAIMLLGTGCGKKSADPITAAHPGLAGLPQAVVAERLSDPAFQETIRNWNEGTRLQMLQLNIASLIYCRDTLKVYQSWVNGGTAPKAPPITAPNRPEPEFASIMKQDIDQVQRVIDSGDPENLRKWLLSSGDGCRNDIADPKDPKKTIADVLS